MKPIRAYLLVILIGGDTFSNYFCDCHEIDLSVSDTKSHLIAAVALLTLLPHAIQSKTEEKDNKPKSILSEDDISGVPNHVIEDILRKAALEKSKREQKKREQVSGLFTKSDQELDPIKCFPKALCGVSSEVAQISKRRKNGLVTEYLVLMKTVARHPDVLNDVVTAKVQGSSLHPHSDSSDVEKDTSASDDDDDASGSEEDDQNDSNEEDDEDDEDDDEDDSPQDDEPATKTKKKKKAVPKPDDDIHKEYLKEKVEMDTLLKDTIEKEAADEEGIWWDESSSRPSKPGGNGPWGRPPGNRPDFQDPYFRGEPFAEMGPPEGPPPPMDEYGSGVSNTNKGGGFTSFISHLFGYGDTSLANDPWFQSAARDLSGDISPGIGVDETREILETALDIGKSFDKPSQCNDIFTACSYDYTELLYMIDDLRRTIRHRVHQKQSNQDKDIRRPLKTSTPSPKVKDKVINYTKVKKTDNAKSGAEIAPLKRQEQVKEQKKRQHQSKEKKNPRKAQRSKKKSKKHFRPSEQLTSDETSGEDPEERWVIPVKPPPTPVGFSISNVLSWFGVNS